MSGKENTLKRVKSIINQLKSINYFPKYISSISLYSICFYIIWILFWIYHYHGYPSILKFNFNKKHEMVEYCKMNDNDLLKNTHLVFGIVSSIGVLTVFVMIFRICKRPKDIAADMAILVWAIVTFGISAVSNITVSFYDFETFRLKSYWGTSSHIFTLGRWITLFIFITISYFVFDIQESAIEDHFYKSFSCACKIISIVSTGISMNMESAIGSWIFLIIAGVTFLPTFTDVYYTYNRYYAVHTFCHKTIDHHIVPKLIGVKKRYGKHSPAYVEDIKERKLHEIDTDFIVQGIFILILYSIIMYKYTTQQ